MPPTRRSGVINKVFIWISDQWEAWNGIVGVKDSSGNTINPATENKQDKDFNLNEILTDGTDTYYCEETKDGEWYLRKMTASGVVTHATITNNVGIATYADARSGYVGLTYNIYSLAF